MQLTSETNPTRCHVHFRYEWRVLAGAPAILKLYELY